MRIGSPDDTAIDAHAFVAHHDPGEVAKAADAQFDPSLTGDEPGMAFENRSQ